MNTTFDEQFEAFNPQGGRFTPSISINETGGIGISSGFIKKYEINHKEIKGVKLFFNRNNNSIGIKFVNELEGNVKIKFADRGGATINAKSFWVRFDISHANFKGKYLPSIVETNEGKVFVVTLKEGTANTAV